MSSDTDASSARFTETGHFIKSESYSESLSATSFEKIQSMKFYRQQTMQLQNYLHQWHEPKITVF